MQPGTVNRIKIYSQHAGEKLFVLFFPLFFSDFGSKQHLLNNCIMPDMLARTESALIPISWGHHEE